MHTQYSLIYNNMAVILKIFVSTNQFFNGTWLVITNQTHSISTVYTTQFTNNKVQQTLVK